MKLSHKLLVIDILFVTAIVWATLNYIVVPEQQTLGILITVMIASVLGNLLLVKGARVRQ